MGSLREGKARARELKDQILVEIHKSLICNINFMGTDAVMRFVARWYGEYKDVEKGFKYLYSKNSNCRIMSK